MDLLRFIEINQELGLPGLDNPLNSGSKVFKQNKSKMSKCSHNAQMDPPTTPGHTTTN
tara:strand:+ start:441 stop:614 length:174 start_codon:yes stop_codon:yes gene_type:complete